MKTPLPKKLTINYQRQPDVEVRTIVNQLIDYLAELTTVVEGRQKNKHYTEEDIELIVEQTMQEISDVVYSEPILLANLKKKEKEIWVDAIINRLMP